MRILNAKYSCMLVNGVEGHGFECEAGILNVGPEMQDVFLLIVTFGSASAYSLETKSYA